jgi:4,5-DOPA dioxygenase extradiol
VRRDPERGLDHGAWCPLAWLYPKADVPVLELSLPTDDPRRLFEMGRALAPLRDENVLILGSGNIVHNLRRTGSDATPTPAWASDFDAWTAATLSARRYDALVDWRKQAPAPDEPTPGSVARAHRRRETTFPSGVGGRQPPRRCVQFG